MQGSEGASVGLLGVQPRPAPCQQTAGQAVSGVSSSSPPANLACACARVCTRMCLRALNAFDCTVGRGRDVKRFWLLRT